MSETVQKNGSPFGMLSMNKTDGHSNARLSRDLPVKRNSRVENENLFHGRGRAPPPTHTHTNSVGRAETSTSFPEVGGPEIITFGDW